MRSLEAFQRIPERILAGDSIDLNPLEMPDPYSFPPEEWEKLDKEAETLDKEWGEILVSSGKIESTMDPVVLYIKQAKRAPLLTRAEEVELAKRIEKKDIEARNKMIVSNLRLVFSIANRFPIGHLDFLDHVQNGNLGLFKAVNRFDWRKGHKFSTYATWWIRQSIHLGIKNEARTIRVPVGMLESLSKIKRVEEKLLLDFGREPTEAEISNESGIELGHIISIRKAEVMQPVSMSTPVGKSEMVTLGEKIESPIDILDQVSDSWRKKALTSALNELTFRSRVVVVRHHGLNGDRETLKELGYRFNVSKGKIRQINAEALARIKENHSELNDLD